MAELRMSRWCAAGEILLVADAMTGQDAVNVAQSFNEKLALTGIVLTRVTAMPRRCALSMKAVTGTPIRLGDRRKAGGAGSLPPRSDRVRILGMGDGQPVKKRPSWSNRTKLNG